MRNLLTRLRHPSDRCWHITGWEPCCCGDPDTCPDNGRGWPIWCSTRISRLRWVLFGACRGHQDGGA